MANTSDENYVNALKDVQRELQSVKATGNHLVWLGLLTAFTLVAGIFVTAYASLGHKAFLSLSPLWYLAGGLVAAGPAFACIAAGFMARQSLQTARANAIILRASQMLLMPADAAGTRITRIGDAVREESKRIDEIVETSFKSFQKLKSQLTEERSAIEASVDANGQHIQALMDKLANERQALAELTSAVESQTASMTDAIPRQARMMAEAAREAQQDIAKSDEALSQQLATLGDTSTRLIDTLTKLGDMGRQSDIRTGEVMKAIAGLEARLNESAKVVDAAVRASELAGLAATETGDTLNAAVASALDGTREASNFIRQQSREASAEAMKAMADLKKAAAEAEAALVAVGATARSQADDTEKRIDEMGDYMFQAAARATSAVEGGLERARLRMERASALLHGFADDDLGPVAPAPQQFTAPTPVTTPPSEPVQPANGLRHRQEDAETLPPDQEDTQDEDETMETFDAETHVEDDLYDNADNVEEASQPLDRPHIILPAKSPDWMSQSSDQMRDLLIDESDRAQLMSERDAGLSWKDLLAGLDTPTEERDESARYLLSEIEEAGVELNELFQPKAVKKIAASARRGERNRRRTVREYAGSAVQTLIFRLQDDVSFRNSSDRFLTVEEPDALRMLTECEKSRSGASPRLTAYLLLDSAMSSI